MSKYDDGVEAFDVDEHDFHAAMNPTGFGRHRLSKQQQIYGVWADPEDSDEEDNRPGLGKSKSKQKDYSAPIGFISGGIKTGDNIKKAEEDDPDAGDVIPDSDDEVEEQPSMSAFRGRKKQKGFGGGMSNKSQTGLYNEMLAGTRTSKGTDGTKFADWNRHTKGLGLKLMQQMGYEKGKGLGKEGKGITAPVEATLRPGRGAIGAYGPEASRPKKDKTLKKSGLDGDVSGSDEDSDDDDQMVGGNRQAGGWKKGAKVAKQKYKTLDEIIGEGGNLKGRLSGFGGPKKPSKIIDMTGREARVYSDYNSALANKPKAPEEGSSGPGPATSDRRWYDCPELVHNLDILVKMTEEEIIRNDRQLKFLQDQNVALEHEEDELSKKIEQDSDNSDKMEKLLGIIQSYDERDAAGDLTLEECKEFFAIIQKDYPTEYKMLGLVGLSFTMVLPRMKVFFSEWDPLALPDYGLDQVKEWRVLLEEGPDWASPPSTEAMDPYHRIIWECVLPRIRPVVLEKWNPRSPDKLIGIIETWKPVFPVWIYVNLLDQLIVPKLHEAVTAWNPCADHVPIHSWLHPWLPLMADRLQVLWGPIRQKLGRALTEGSGWHPSDKSAKSILQPWVGVFTKGSMESFIARHIVPRLEMCLQAWEVNPSKQDLRTWEWVTNWMDMIPPSLIATMLVQYFFPKWHKALITWLSCANPNYSEITHWYSGWKTMFPDELLELSLIKDQFHRALEMMNRAVSGGGAPSGAREEVAYLSATERIRQAELAAAQRKKDMEFLSSSTGPTSFKDLIETRAADNGFTFVPIPNRYREGKQVYRFGPLQIYVEKSVVFCMKSTGLWEPISLDNLVLKAKTAS